MNDILEWYNEIQQRHPVGMELGPRDGSGPGCRNINHEEPKIELKIEPIEPEIKPNVPDEVKEVRKEVKALNLINQIQDYLKFYASYPSDNMMNKENVIKKIQGMIEELSGMVGSL